MSKPVTRDDIIEYLRTHPSEATKYYKRVSTQNRRHDNDTMGQKDGQYFVAWMDHGQPRFEKTFATLAEAVAEHVLVSYGMY
jgi:hypothetical protein